MVKSKTQHFRSCTSHLVMNLSRRDFCVVGLCSTVPNFGTPLSADTPGSGSPHSGVPMKRPIYRDSLVDGLTPSAIWWSDRSWRSNMGSAWHAGMHHCFQYTRSSARFELRDTIFDRSPKDPAYKRRSELSGSLYGNPRRLPNGVQLWGAMQFNHHPWEDSQGMAERHGGIHGQIHIGNRFGGSPAVAFRRTSGGDFQITTRGEFDRDGTVRWRGAVPFGTAHDLVYSVVLHETAGTLRVWLDGVELVAIEAQSIGTHHGDSYWNVGCYYAGGITCPVVAEFANHIYPGTAELSRRVAHPPRWS